jgi:hypothetical protein
MAKQTQVFENKTSRVMDVYVEAYPDRYRLKPNDEMHITYEREGEGYGLHTIIHDHGGLQLYLDNFDTAVVTINGKLAEPWAD